MSKQKIARIVAVVILAVACLVLAVFEIQGARGRLVGNEALGELFILIVRQDGGLIDFAKQAVLPVITAVTINIQFSSKRDWATTSIWILIGVYSLLMIIFFFEFQVSWISEELWVNDKQQTFVRDPTDVAVNQAGFEAVIRYFCYQSMVAIVTYSLVLMGIQSRDKQPKEV